MIKLSKTSKMRNKSGIVPSWSLQAGKHCPASLDENGEPVEVCKSCYAKGGAYRFGVVKKVRDENAEDWQRDEWVIDMVKAIVRYRYFRWFDSGDVYSAKLAEKIYEVIAATPKTRHWLPTRMNKVKRVSVVLDKIKTLSNVCVRLSADTIDEFRDDMDAYVITEKGVDTCKDKGIVICPVTIDKERISCNNCTKCYDKEVKVAYLLH